MEIKRENEGILMQRIRNQLRIHWSWLKKKDYNEVADFIDGCMRQALSHNCIFKEKDYIGTCSGCEDKDVEICPDTGWCDKCQKKYAEEQSEKEKGFNLSFWILKGDIIPVIYIKEFIKILKEELSDFADSPSMNSQISGIIDKLAGEKLAEEESK